MYNLTQSGYRPITSAMTINCDYSLLIPIGITGDGRCKLNAELVLNAEGKEVVVEVESILIPLTTYGQAMCNIAKIVSMRLSNNILSQLRDIVAVQPEQKIRNSYFIQVKFQFNGESKVEALRSIRLQAVEGTDEIAIASMTEGEDFRKVYQLLRMLDYVYDDDIRGLNAESRAVHGNKFDKQVELVKEINALLDYSIKNIVQ